MAGFAKIFGEGAAQVLIMRSRDYTGNALVTFYVDVDGTTHNYNTVFHHNETSDQDAELFFDAIDETIALARGAMLRDLFANPPEDATEPNPP